MTKIWLFGIHTCLAALQNPRRVCYRLLCIEKLQERFSQAKIKAEIASSKEISMIIKADVPHQGVVLQVDPLQPENLGKFLNKDRALIVVLDQVTDPRNVGAIMRVAAAFGVDCLVHQSRHSASESATLAKAASGALDIIGSVNVVNIGRTLEELKAAGFWIYGLDCAGTKDLRNERFSEKTAIVLGSEGDGMRRNIREKCDFLLRINIAGVQSLNVSMAAGVALYQHSLSVSNAL